MSTAYVALGSNLGDRLGHLGAAVAALATHPALELGGRSRVYETDPVGGPAGQAPYLNAVVRLETELPARQLLEVLLEVERGQGRERLERWGPRTLDLDLLLYGLETIHEPGLVVPHPRMTERAFVLAPLADLAPHLELPGLGNTVAGRLERLDRTGVRETGLVL